MDLLVGIQGAHFDGNDFLASSKAQVVVATSGRRVDPAPAQTLLSTQMSGVEAVQALASLWRRRLSCKVVAITGSSGKTSTKEMVAAICRAAYGEAAVLATSGNHNNQLGMPYTLLQASPDTKVMILEMGMSGRGEIARLVQIARPDIGAITNIGYAHLEQLGSREQIARAKSELTAQTALAVLPARSTFKDLLEQLAQGQVCFFEQPANFGLDQHGCAYFTYQGQPIRLGVPGLHQLNNAMCAIEVARALAIGPAAIAEGLAAVRLPGERSRMCQTAGGALLIDDSYNANPDSMEAALDLLSRLPAHSPRIAVLGDMLELGPDSRRLHEQVGAIAASRGIGLLCAVGGFAEALRCGFDTAMGEMQEGSRQNQHVLAFASVDDFKAAFPDFRAAFGRQAAVLVKASRGMHFEDLAAWLVEQLK
jgi:UDP-N-acetylmuramoyl-tripeptide--D-alanyl-D-alanine ligase